MNAHLLSIEELDRTDLALLGGKAATLGELSRIEDIYVPRGVCVTTEVYKKVIENNESLNRLMDKLSLLEIADRDRLSELGDEIRKLIEEAAIPQDIVHEIFVWLKKYDDKQSYAVRSSATAEDLPTASFAGQQDSYLNIKGRESILKHISKCWASLFTNRAIIYRMQNGFPHRAVQMAVIIQNMVSAQAAGVMFTADPVTSNRKVISIDAAFGLGEAVVSGLVNTDLYTIRTGKITSKKISCKKCAIGLSKEGGTIQQEVKPLEQNKPVLTDRQIRQLEQSARKIEKHFGNPQDIEWCLAKGKFYFLQSRPITTLYPVPDSDDGENRAYISVGHNQMMTDAMKPLGLSFFQMITHGQMHVAGGRLFVDITSQLASPESRKKFIDTLRFSDPLFSDAVWEIARRKDFIRMAPESKAHQAGYVDKSLTWKYLSLFEKNNDIVSGLISENERSVEAMRLHIKAKTGAELIDFILEDINELKKLLFSPKSWEVIKIAFYAHAWINKKLEKWLGEKNLADRLSQSLSNNITSEMGLALLDVADVIRPHAEVIDYLQREKGDAFLNELPKLKGGVIAQEAIIRYLDKYGMRCVGEIDITRRRWSEKPSTLVPLLVSNIKNFAPASGKRKFDEGLSEVAKNEGKLIHRLLQLSGGKRKAGEMKRMIGLMRKFMGYREYPKYGLVNRYYVYKQALLNEARKLSAADIIHDEEDIYYLSFGELGELIRSGKPDYKIIDKRKKEYAFFEKLTPPRVITSAGEMITGSYKRIGLPAGAMPGLGVSFGIIEGKARVMLKMDHAEPGPEDILVTTFTDPSWTPLFVSVKGLVTEVGGLMTHGAVIAREYGLPAVVGVENATTKIKDGQWIRINGAEGYVEIIG